MEPLCWTPENFLDTKPTNVEAFMIFYNALI